jgi:hypothetical protein
MNYTQGQHLFPVSMYFIFRVVLFYVYTPQLMYDKGKIHYFIYLLEVYFNIRG